MEHRWHDADRERRTDTRKTSLSATWCSTDPTHIGLASDRVSAVTNRAVWQKCTDVSGKRAEVCHNFGSIKMETAFLRNVGKFLH
jgi:hypothetical protein